MAIQTLVLEPAQPAVASIVMLHGLGADGTDFLPLADEMDLSALGPVRWVLPRAPVRPVTINNGYRMRAWYDILATDLGRREDEQGLRESAAEVLGLLEHEVARGVPPHRIVLAGFSQGAAITLLAGLRSPHRLAGLAGLSGYLPLADAALAEAHATQRDVPIFLAHGRQDTVVAIDRGQLARQRLQAAGWSVQWHDYPMEHSLCIEEVRHLQAWLLEVLAAQGR